MDRPRGSLGKQLSRQKQPQEGTLPPPRSPTAYRLTQPEHSHRTQEPAVAARIVTDSWNIFRFGRDPIHDPTLRLVVSNSPICSRFQSLSLMTLTLAS